MTFLVIQTVLVVASQLGESRWFSWAPHTVQVRYRIEATLDGRPLDARAIGRRFGVPATGWEAHAVKNLQDLIEQYARTYGRDERLTVMLRYAVNGRPEQTWTRPAGADR
jgi:hypothetical protein